MIWPYLIHLLVLVGIYAILTSSLNLSVGYTGLLNLGHIAFFGIGAYTSALLMIAGVPFFFSLLIAGLCTSLFAYILIFATKKLKGDYLAITTLGFSFLIYSILLSWTKLTNGALGIPGIPRPSIFGFTLIDPSLYLVLVVVVAFVSLFILFRIVKSPFGKLLEALRDDELALKVLGKNTTRLKYKSLMISAFFAAIAGSLYAHYLSYIDPSFFVLSETILIFTILIIGGVASMKGSIVASFVIIIIPDILRFLHLSSMILGPLRQIIYAIILLAILFIRPRGLFGRIDLNDA